LSKEFVENHIGGSTAELMTINSIVASLTELPGIDKVQFLIEGNVREVLSMKPWILQSKEMKVL